MHEDVARAFEFMRRGDIAGSREEPSSVGLAVFEDRLPQRWDSNYLYVESDCDFDEVAAEFERLDRRVVLVPDEEKGERLAAEAKDGWHVDRQVVMVHRRPPDRSPNLSSIREVGERDLRPVRRRLILTEPWGDAATADTILGAKPLIAERVTARFFAAYEDGEIASYSDLYIDPPEAQIEDVATVPEHRNKGLASAVVLRALAEAHAAGADFVFLVANDDDWPKELYSKLGFDAAGRYFRFRPP